MFHVNIFVNGEGNPISGAFPIFFIGNLAATAAHEQAGENRLANFEE